MGRFYEQKCALMRKLPAVYLRFRLQAMENKSDMLV